MFTKTNRWMLILTVSLLVVLAAIISQPAQASASQHAGASDNSCLTCHEDLYYLHDTGCWYCMTPAHKDRCIDCHVGNPTSMKVEESHLGMLAHPQENNGAKCLECHEQAVVQTHLVTFEANRGGFNEVIRAEAYTPSAEAEAGFLEVAKVNPIVANWKFLTGTSLIFGLLLVLVLVSPLKP
jgi:hypothetical protein